MPPEDNDIFSEPDIDKEEIMALESMVDNDPDKNKEPTAEEIAASKAGKAVADEGEKDPEADAALAAAEAAKAAGKDAGDKGQKEVPSGFVPHAALHEARLEAKLLKQQLSDVSARLGVVDQLKSQLDAMRHAGKTTEKDDPAPNKDEDPVAYLEWENRQIKRDLKTVMDERNAGKQSTEENTKQQAQIQSFMDDVREQVLDFEKAQPDYGNAFAHVAARRVEDYKAMGITKPDEIRMTLDREVMSVAATAMQRGINPGQAMYALAKNMGYVPAKPADPKPGDKPADKKVGESLTDQLDRLEKGGKAGGMNGGADAGDTPLTLEAIDQMTDKEFDEYWNKNVGGNSIYQ